MEVGGVRDHSVDVAIQIPPVFGVDDSGAVGVFRVHIEPVVKVFFNGNSMTIPSIVVVEDKAFAVVWEAGEDLFLGASWHDT